MISKEIQLITYIKDCPEIMETLNACKVYGLKNYYLAGGVITQLIWNNLSNKSNLDKVKDFDIVYYEESKKSKIHHREISKLVKHNIELDIVNQAYVHEWYHLKHGNEITKFKNTEEGIQSWLSAFAIGIRMTSEIEIYSPYGLTDAFSKNVRPNKKTMNKNNYSKMTNSFKARWNDIQITPWDELSNTPDENC